MQDKVIGLDNIVMNDVVDCKDELLHKISEHAYKLGIVNDIEETYQGFLNREKEVSTGFTDGFAIPHTRAKSVVKTGVLIHTLNPSIDWPSMDGEKTNFVIALLVPENDESANVHMQLLSRISRLLVSNEFRQKLSQAVNKEEVYQIFEDIL